MTQSAHKFQVSPSFLRFLLDWRDIVSGGIFLPLVRYSAITSSYLSWLAFEPYFPNRGKLSVDSAKYLGRIFMLQVVGKTFLGHGELLSSIRLNRFSRRSIVEYKLYVQLPRIQLYERIF